jgi:TIR domain
VKVFISHTTSDKPIVDALRVLITTTFVEVVEVAYSSASVSAGGISAGQDWLEWIRAQVQDSAMAIVVVTPLSKTRPWLMWEAGAVSGVGLARKANLPVVPLTYGLRDDEVPDPLATRQVKSGTAADDLRDLLESICRSGTLSYRAPDQVAAALTTYLDTVKAAGIPGMHDVFISCPMTSLPDDGYTKMRNTIEALTDAMNAKGFTAYSAVRRILTRDTVDPETIAAEQDLPALTTSRNFLMIYPGKILSSCLLEAGYALVAGIPSLYFVKSDDDLPYLLRGAVESFRNTRRVKFRDESEIVKFFERYPERVIT